MKRLLLIAACVSIPALLTAVPAQADTGVVAGVVTAEATGEPVGGACVTVFDTDLTEVTSGCADPAGHYEIADVAPGYYKVRATADSYSELWAHRRGSGLAAEVVWLPGSLDFALRQGNGTVRGQVTDQGAPAAGASVSITDVNQRWWSTVLTASDGTYAFAGLAPDTYKVQFTFGDRDQWAPQKDGFYSAGEFVVADDVTVVDEAIAPYASVRVLATDATTGAPIVDACSRVDPVERQECAGADGVMRYDNLPPFRSYTLGVWAAGGTHWGEGADVAVSPGATTDLTVSMRPAASITTTVRDARTKAPLERICVELQAVPVIGVLDADYLNHCSDSTGRLVIGPIDPGTYQLLVKPLDERYGMQWVGTAGGTGDLRRARTVTAAVGAPVTIPPIEMDPAGTITGVVTDRATGAPVNLVCVYPFAVDPRIGLGFRENCTRGDGTYTISGLGPYAWPLEFLDSQRRYATQWSGGSADRFAARPVRVRPNNSVTANAALVPGGAVSGVVRDQEGDPAFGYVYVHNARTGDIIDWTTPSMTTDEYVLAGLATQDIKIRYYVDVNCWHRDAADFASATPVRVTAGQTTGGVDLGPCAL